ncbi:F-box protein CPR1-like [Papaver somniferum]|uniref:F-box protein CPR1-like n=1 Tax=Papaver somniferum TaxID=3469 RepID=UPI000E6F7E50|nr:F-box protein CPR1-like [Papaver somniferum]
MSSIIQDVYYEVFIRLPVESLLLCRSVCKSWVSIISSPAFVKYHLDFNSKNTPRLIYQNPERNFCISSSKSEKDVGCPSFKDPSCDIDLLGSCNGLVCLRFGYNGGLLCVWNPATRQCSKIPRSPNGVPKPEINNTYAFGYDYKIGDYRLLIARESSVDVYTLGLGSWENNDDGDILLQDGSGVVLYDPEHPSAIKQISHGSNAVDKHNYVESLISPNSCTFK